MPGIEVNGSAAICTTCGQAYGRRKGYFLVSYSRLHKGTGYMPYCSRCVDEMYNAYLAAGLPPKDAVRQMCRKLDLYWNAAIFNTTERTNSTRSMMTSYVTKINGVKNAGKCYDDTLREEGRVCDWNTPEMQPVEVPSAAQKGSAELEPDEDVDPAIRAFWGSGFTKSFYDELEYKYKNWTEGLDVIDPGERAIYKQICILEATINRDSAAGKSIDKNVNALNALLGSANLKPAQKKSEEQDIDLDNMPFGVGIRRWENTRPVPEPDPELRDVDGIIRYITIWFLGHLCKMLGIKNSYCKLYEQEIERLRVERPEFKEDDDEELFNDIFTNGEQNE